MGSRVRLLFCFLLSTSVLSLLFTRYDLGLQLLAEPGHSNLGTSQNATRADVDSIDAKSETYVSCARSSLDPLRVVFGMLAGPKYISTRVVHSLRSYLASEVSVVYLEDGRNVKVRRRVEKHLINNPLLVGVKFTVTFLEKSDEEIKINSVTGGWKNLPILHDLWKRFGGHGSAAAEWYVTVDDDTFVVVHNMYLHLSTYYTPLQRLQQCTGWSKYTRYRAAILKANPLSTHPFTNFNTSVPFKDARARSLFVADGISETAPQYLGWSLSFSEPSWDASVNSPRRKKKVHFIHGGGGIFINRPAMEKLIDADCIPKCKQSFAGDFRVGCCAQHAQIVPTGDKHFSFLPPLRSLVASSVMRRFPRGKYPISFHATRTNHSLPVHLHALIREQLGAEAPSCTLLNDGYSSTGCSSRALRDYDATMPLEWDALRSGFQRKPWVTMYPPNKLWEWGKPRKDEQTDDDRDR